LILGTFADSNPTATPPTVTAKISWGDGTTGTGKVVAVAGGFAVEGSHTYIRQGKFNPIITFADSGSSVKASRTTIVVGRKTKGKPK
jgi:hypothetical protein